jgi:hypothetical protein
MYSTYYKALFTDDDTNFVNIASLSIYLSIYLYIFYFLIEEEEFMYLLTHVFVPTR